MEQRRPLGRGGSRRRGQDFRSTSPTRASPRRGQERVAVVVEPNPYRGQRRRRLTTIVVANALVHQSRTPAPAPPGRAALGLGFERDESGENDGDWSVSDTGVLQV